MLRRVSIRLNANIKDYKVKIWNCDTLLIERVTDNKTCLTIFTKDRFLKLMISPVNDEYYTSFYYNLDICSACCYNLSFNFMARENNIGASNTFYLTDRIYGLKINGTLNFNSV